MCMDLCLCSVWLCCCAVVVGKRGLECGWVVGAAFCGAY